MLEVRTDRVRNVRAAPRGVGARRCRRRGAVLAGAAGGRAAMTRVDVGGVMLNVEAGRTGAAGRAAARLHRLRCAAGRASSRRSRRSSRRSRSTSSATGSRTHPRDLERYRMEQVADDLARAAARGRLRARDAGSATRWAGARRCRSRCSHPEVVSRAGARGRDAPASPRPRSATRASPRDEVLAPSASNVTASSRSSTSGRPCRSSPRRRRCRRRSGKRSAPVGCATRAIGLAALAARHGHRRAAGGARSPRRGARAGAAARG